MMYVTQIRSVERFVCRISGQLAFRGQALSSLRDLKKNKVILDAAIPIDAEITVGEIVVPLPSIT